MGWFPLTGMSVSAGTSGAVFYWKPQGEQQTFGSSSDQVSHLTSLDHGLHEVDLRQPQAVRAVELPQIPRDGAGGGVANQLKGLAQPGASMCGGVVLPLLSIHNKPAKGGVLGLKVEIINGFYW